MDRRMGQVPQQNQDKGKAPQVPGEVHDQAPDQNQDKGKAPQVPDLDQDLDRDQVPAEDEYYDVDHDEDDDDDDEEEDKAEQALAAEVQIPDEDQDHQDQARAPQVPDQDEDRLQNQDQNAMPKRSMGRQKVDIAKIQNESNLKVTFSKRRHGLFKKGSELVTLCGVELVIIVFSPGNKPFSFGHPSVDEIIDRFLSRAAPLPDTANNIMLAQRYDNVQILNNQLTNMQAMFEAERQKKLDLDQARAASRAQRPWEAPIDELGRDELVALKAAMLNLQANVAKHIEMRMQLEQQNPSAFQPGGSSFGGGGGVGSTGGGQGAASGSYGGVDPAFSTGLNYFGGGVGGAVQFPQGSSSLGRGSGHALQIGPSSSGLGNGGALHIGPSPSGRGRGRGRPPGSGRGRGRGSGSGRGSQ